ncbi:unnamed protein product [Fraxinus pennsylvanica]|uniref:ZZ-type domain-containing protein n=1 Tax=Fraxinus pennsylvanica TaxID=56036 RepID=A0AAD1ZDH7_9LAMI|nr:unnamed protein product [Fraxinus pennsylvanica]
MPLRNYFDMPPQSGSHGFPFKRSNSQSDCNSVIFHRDVHCDGCGVYPITGIRFKSKVKENYDLCSICFAKLGNDIDYISIDRPVVYRHSSLSRPRHSLYLAYVIFSIAASASSKNEQSRCETETPTMSSYWRIGMKKVTGGRRRLRSSTVSSASAAEGCQSGVRSVYATADLLKAPFSAPSGSLFFRAAADFSAIFDTI